VITPASEALSAGSWEGRFKQPKLLKWTMVVNIEIHCVGEGDIRVMVPELLFKGLKTLLEEDKDVCFLHPGNFTNQAR
jgi:hypothetical protein